MQHLVTLQRVATVTSEGDGRTKSDVCGVSVHVATHRELRAAGHAGRNVSTPRATAITSNAGVSNQNIATVAIEPHR